MQGSRFPQSVISNYTNEFSALVVLLQTETEDMEESEHKCTEQGDAGTCSRERACGYHCSLLQR
jgi:hypothetical protein